MKTNPTITTTILITAISRLDLIVNLINNSIQIIEKQTTRTETIKIPTQMETTNTIFINSHPVIYWILQLISIVVIFYVVYRIFKEIYSLRDELKLHSIINKVRDIENFKETYSGVEFCLLPNESLEDFAKRDKSGIYNEKVKNEIIAVRNRAINILSNKTIYEIDKLIINAYNLKPKNRP